MLSMLLTLHGHHYVFHVCHCGLPIPITRNTRYQGATWNAGANEMQWYIENAKEECDYPGEYYLDAEEEALYYTFNATEPAATGEEKLALTAARSKSAVT